MPRIKANTGDDDSNLQRLLSSILKRDIIPRPNTYIKGMDMNHHLERIAAFNKNVGVDDDDAKLGILLSSLDDFVQSELFCQPDYTAEKDNDWVVNKLIVLFGEHTSTITPLMKLLNVKQDFGQSIRDFVSDLRVAAYRYMKQVCVEDREKHILEAFIAGLLDKNIANALRSLRPNSLQEAFELSRKEEKRLPAEDVHVRAMPAEQDVITSMKYEIASLKKQVHALHLLMSKPLVQPRPTVARTRPDAQRPTNQQQICYNCQGAGHFARECRNRTVCRFCGLHHRSVDCKISGGRTRNAQNTFRRLDDEVEELDHAQEEVSNISDPVPDAAGDFFVLASKRSMQKKKQYSEKRLVAESNASRWADYVDGKVRRPMTVISENHSEVAANKPIVRGKLQGIQGKFFLDTGANINVIDKTLFDKLAKCSGVTLRSKPLSIRCANGTFLNCIGTAFLNVAFGHTNVFIEFKVVASIFPKVFLGIRALKKLNANIDLRGNCMNVNGETFSFLSHVDDASSSKTEN